MPLADRNLFDALKHERWAQKGKDKAEVRHMFVQLVRCVEHMHGKGMIHGDLKVTTHTLSTHTLSTYPFNILHIHTHHHVNTPYDSWQS